MPSLDEKKGLDLRISLEVHTQTAYFKRVGMMSRDYFPPLPSFHSSFRLKVDNPSGIIQPNLAWDFGVIKKEEEQLGNVGTKFISEMILLSRKTHGQAMDGSLFRIKIAFLVHADISSSSLFPRNSCIALPLSLVSNISQMSLCRTNLILLVPEYRRMLNGCWFRRERGKQNNWMFFFVSLFKVSKMKTTRLWRGRVSWKKITLSRSTRKPTTHQRSMSVICLFLLWEPPTGRQKLAEHRQLIWENSIKRICSRGQ